MGRGRTGTAGDGHLQPGPSERYRRNLERAVFCSDPAQEKALAHFERLYRALQSRERGFLRRLLQSFFRLSRKPPAPPGVYLWGGVGRGKTQLMDLFHDSLSVPAKRVHFHRFMHGVHGELRRCAGEKNPLQKIAARMSRQLRVLCLDEFLVTDIGDAMILGGLLRELFDQGLCLVATSNTAPQDLYRDGLQRQRFLPAIELLCRHCVTVQLEDGVDYRLRALERAPLYHCPADENAERQLARSFSELATDSSASRTELEINGRMLRARCLGDDVAWFDFPELCAGPRSQDDYIELAREFHAVLLSGVPRFAPGSEDIARRFIHLVDILYDHKVKLALSADAEPQALYEGQHLEADFQRTASRLREMRTHHYLEQAHKA